VVARTEGNTRVLILIANTVVDAIATPSTANTAVLPNRPYANAAKAGPTARAMPCALAAHTDQIDQPDRLSRSHDRY